MHTDKALIKDKLNYDIIDRCIIMIQCHYDITSLTQSNSRSKSVDVCFLICLIALAL